jgi:membrane protein YdbS with pleckstrin-like domain
VLCAPPERTGVRVVTTSEACARQQKLARQRTHITILSVALVLVLLMLAYASIFDLNPWPEWVVLGAICVTGVGALIAVNTRAD